MSRGQRHTLQLASALETQPTILILDAATSALDPAIEKQILNTIIHRKCTIILATHRLRAVSHCDNIIVLQQGKIIETGNHAELINNNGLYKKLIDLE